MFFLSSSPHQRVKTSTSDMMRLVIYCLVPGIIAQVVFFGWGVLFQIAIAVATAIACEAAVMELRKRPIEPVIADFSGILTAVLLAISIPPYAPWWVIVIGTAFAIVMVKHLYGGLGNNLFNPAMAGYVLLLISFPVEMTTWLPAQQQALHGFNFGDALSTIMTGFTVEGYSLEQMRQTIDGYSMATPLDEMRTQISQGFTSDEVLASPHLDNYGTTSWFWINLCYLFGGLVLWRKNAIGWQIPFAIIVGLLISATVGFMASPDTTASATYHLFSGATMLGAFFIATDPVSASTTVRGRIIYGAFIGVLVYLIRCFGGYPDAFAFAVLLANMAVPLVDYYTQPTTYGTREAGKND